MDEVVVEENETVDEGVIVKESNVNEVGDMPNTDVVNEHTIYENANLGAELVDEDNNVSEVEVDMRYFRVILETNVGSVGTDELRDIGVGEADVEVIDNDTWDSLDDQSDEYYKRRCVLKNLAKEKRCTLGSVHKARVYVGQKFKTKDELKEKKINTHALKTRVISSSGVVDSSKGKGKWVNSNQVKCMWTLHASRSDTTSDW
ncbi:hypothetical protein L1887_23160 [Cichorium endivia]|nr:hypothetical protein L1887_23160 [Cichorium endivia]